jgi:NAD+ synthase (glutamine-hydrolysing)
MKIYVAQQNYHIGDFALNRDKIIRAVEDGRKAGADLIVFSELSVCGYPPRDFLEFEDFMQQLHVYLLPYAPISLQFGSQWTMVPLKAYCLSLFHEVIP